jgi:hypothetical protein
MRVASTLNGGRGGAGKVRISKIRKRIYPQTPWQLLICGRTSDTPPPLQKWVRGTSPTSPNLRSTACRFRIRKVKSCPAWDANLLNTKIAAHSFVPKNFLTVTNSPYLETTFYWRKLLPNPTPRFDDLKDPHLRPVNPPSSCRLQDPGKPYYYPIPPCSQNVPRILIWELKPAETQESKWFYKIPWPKYPNFARSLHLPPKHNYESG